MQLKNKLAITKSLLNFVILRRFGYYFLCNTSKKKSYFSGRMLTLIGAHDAKFLQEVEILAISLLKFLKIVLIHRTTLKLWYITRVKGLDRVLIHQGNKARGPNFPRIKTLKS